MVELVTGSPGPGLFRLGSNLFSGVGPSEWAAQLADWRYDLGAQIRQSFVARVIARQISYSHRGRSLNGPQIQTRAALLAAKLTSHSGGVIDVRL